MEPLISIELSLNLNVFQCDLKYIAGSQILNKLQLWHLPSTPPTPPHAHQMLGCGLTFDSDFVFTSTGMSEQVHLDGHLPNRLLSRRRWLLCEHQYGH